MTNSINWDADLKAYKVSALLTAILVLKMGQIRNPDLATDIADSILVINNEIWDRIRLAPYKLILKIFNIRR